MFELAVEEQVGKIRTQVEDKKEDYKLCQGRETKGK